MATIGYFSCFICRRDYNLGGTYRRLLCKPLDLQWKCARYNDPTLSLVSSDWDRLQGTDPHPGVEGWSCVSSLAGCVRVCWEFMQPAADLLYLG